MWSMVRFNFSHLFTNWYIASCSAHCKQCSSESVCTTCKGSYLKYQSECFASCPDATIATSSTLCEGTLLLGLFLTFLKDCPTHCKQCSSTSVCDVCKDSYILYQSQCLDSCPDGMFLSTTTGTCEGTFLLRFNLTLQKRLYKSLQ